MRLNETRRKVTLEEVGWRFGNEAVVRLFGSRLDDRASGGDRDLPIETDGSPPELLDREVRLRARLLRRLGERGIDVVVHAHHQPPRPIDEQARKIWVAL